MKNIFTVLFAALLTFFTYSLAVAETPYQVTFATQECNGDTGFATVGIDLIYKVDSAGCSAADGSPLKQLLVHNSSGSYDVYTISQQESENIMKEIKSYMDARRGLLERSDAIIVKP